MAGQSPDDKAKAARARAHFQSGVRLDDAGRHAEAEGEFLLALAADQELHGDVHGNVAETLHSLGLVREHLGHHEGALVARRQAAAILAQVQPVKLCDGLNAVARSLMALGRLDEAGATFDEAIAAARVHSATPVYDTALAFLGAGEALREAQRFPEAFSRFATATQLTRPDMPPRLVDCLARVWHSLGVVSRDTMHGGATQAAFSFWYATLLGSGEVAAKARRELANLPERRLCHGEAGDFRLVYDDGAGNVHVASLRHGLFHARILLPAALGDVVRVALVDGEVHDIQPV